MDSTSRREVSVLDMVNAASGRNNAKFCIVIYYFIYGMNVGRIAQSV